MVLGAPGLEPPEGSGGWGIPGGGGRFLDPTAKDAH